jgi:acyl-CoA dehydrogenase
MTLVTHRNAPGEPALGLARQVRTFIDEQVIPREPELAGDSASASACQDELATQARIAGLWGLFYPASHGGKLASLADYLWVAEQEGRSEYGPAIFGADATLDTHMLLRHGSQAIKRDFLAPLLMGEAVSSYGMSEPQSIGSIPATLTTSAEQVAGGWRLNGRKWFICRADCASFVTVVARTAEGELGGALSMILVPTDAAGFRIERQLDILGRFTGQCEIAFSDVVVPRDYLLGQAGRGLALMQERLGLGRVLRAAHWLGLAQRCFDLMCKRICSDRGEMARLTEKQLVRLRVFQSFQAIAGARALLHDAAHKFDARLDNNVEVNLAKVAASQALSTAVDHAIQIFGAEGLCDLSPLSGIYRTARTTHILDGTDDALISAVGRRLLDAYATGGLLDFSTPSVPAGAVPA